MDIAQQSRVELEGGFPYRGAYSAPLPSISILHLRALHASLLIAHTHTSNVNGRSGCTSGLVKLGWGEYECVGEKQAGGEYRAPL